MTSNLNKPTRKETVMPRTRSSLNKYENELAMIQYITDELASMSADKRLTPAQVRERNRLLIDFGEYNTRLGPGLLPWLGFVDRQAFYESLKRGAAVIGSFLFLAAVFLAVAWVIYDVIDFYMTYARLIAR